MYGEEMTILFQKMQPKWDQKYLQLYDTHERDAIVAREAFGQAEAK